jgi:hypothetical protein
MQQVKIGSSLRGDNFIYKQFYDEISTLQVTLAEHKKTTTYDVGNPSLDLEQAHKCGCIKPFNVS